MKTLFTGGPRSALRQGGIVLMSLTFLPLTACMLTEADLKMTEKNLQQRIKQQDDQFSQTRAKQSQEIASLREQELPQLRRELESVMHQVQELQAKQEDLKQQIKWLDQVVGKVERPTGAKKSSGTIANDSIGAAGPENAAAMNKLSNRGLAIKAESVFPDGQDPIDTAIQHGMDGHYDLAKSEVEQTLTLNQWDQRALAVLRLTSDAIAAKTDSETFAHLFRAAQLGSAGRVDESLSEIDLAIKRSPNYVLAYINRGNARLMEGNVDGSIADYDHAISLDSSDAVAYYNRGVAYIKKKNYSIAIADFSKAIALDPNDTASYKNRGNTNQLLGKHDEAIADYNRAIAINPRDSHAFYNRAEEWSRSGKFDKAVTDYGKAIAIDKTLAEAYDSRGFVYLEKLGKTQPACIDWNRACELGRCSNLNLAKSKGYCK